jgi:hypothetical protein
VLLLFGRWRTLAWSALFGGLLVLLTATLQRFDLSPWSRWLQGSVALATQADPWAVPAFEFPPFEWMNQSLRFALARWCGVVPPEFAKDVKWGLMPGLGLPVDTVGWIVRSLSLALLGSVLVSAWRLRASPVARLWLVAATLVLSLLLSPISWKGHHVALLPVVLLLVQRAIVHRQHSARWLLGIWFVACALLGGDLVGDGCDEWLNSIYVVTFGDVALFVAALLAARDASRTDAAKLPSAP